MFGKDLDKFRIIKKERDMIEFDLDRFLKEKRLVAREFAEMLKCSLATVYFAKTRGTIKPSFLRKIESIYGDCSQYLQVEKAEAV